MIIASGSAQGIPGKRRGILFHADFAYGNGGRYRLYPAFNGKPIYVEGSAFLLIMAFTFGNMPWHRIGYSTLIQIDRSIEEASTILGATGAVTSGRKAVPMLSRRSSRDLCIRCACETR